MNNNKTSIIQNILLEIESYQFFFSKPTIEKIKELAIIISQLELDKTQEQLLIEIRTQKEPTTKSIRSFISFAADLFMVDSLENPDDGKLMNYTQMVLEWNVLLEPKPIIEYDALGDLWLILRKKPIEALSCYKASLSLINENNLEIDNEINNNNYDYLAGLYFKIGICLIIKSEKRKARFYMNELEQKMKIKSNILNENGFDSWKDVYILIDAIEISSGEDISDEELVKIRIEEAVDLKRRGMFKKANELYNQLNKEFPNKPNILLSWAKTLVCLQHFDDAVEKYATAYQLFYDIGEFEKSKECAFQLDKVVVRSADPIGFNLWVRGISGGSITEDIYQ